MDRSRVILTVLLLYAAALLVLGPALRLSQWELDPDRNQSAAEAVSWLSGRLDLPSRGGDTALYDGRVYNVFPPFWPIVCAAILGVHRLLFGELLVIFPIEYVAVLALPIPALFYLAMRRAGAGTSWAAVLAMYAMAGTCLWPVAAMCRIGWIYSMQHVSAQIGIALLLIDVFGRRRYWLGGIGVMIAAWSRQFCLLYSGPLCYLAWRDSRRGPALTRAAVPLAITLALPMGLSWARFGTPFETGYRYLFVDNHSQEAKAARGQDGEPQIFHTRYMAAHARDMWLTPPFFDWTVDGPRISGPGGGTGLFYGSPLLLLVLYDWRRWWGDPARRALMLSTIPIILGLLAYYAPGYGTPGYYRYTLDFSLVWLAVIAPGTEGKWRSWFTLGCLAWSAHFFYQVTEPCVGPISPPRAGGVPAAGALAPPGRSARWQVDS